MDLTFATDDLITKPRNWNVTMHVTTTASHTLWDVRTEQTKRLGIAFFTAAGRLHTEMLCGLDVGPLTSDNMAEIMIGNDAKDHSGIIPATRKPSDTKAASFWRTGGRGEQSARDDSSRRRSASPATLLRRS